jgi:hypothetical protein
MSWDSIPLPQTVGAGSNGPKDSLFLEWEGTIRIRLVGEGAMYSRHYVSPATGARAKAYIKCCDYDKPVGTPKTCPVCAMNNKARVRVMAPVIDVASGNLRFIDIPQSAAAQIKALARNPEWGNPLGYDISITEVKISNRTDFQVLPSSQKTPIHPEMQARIADFLSKYDYKHFVAPNTPEEAVALMNGQKVVRTLKSAAAIAQAEQYKATPPAYQPQPAPSYTMPIPQVAPVYPAAPTPVPMYSVPAYSTPQVPQVAPVQPIAPVQPYVIPQPTAPVTSITDAFLAGQVPPPPQIK